MPLSDRRDFLRLLLAGAAVPVLAGCERPAKDTTAQNKVGLLVTGPITDGSWNQSAWEGVQRIREETGAEISNVKVNPSAFQSEFENYARQGYRLIIGHGNEFGDAVKRVAPSYPKSYFLVSSGTVAGPNFTSIEFEIGEAAYLLGMIAASLSKSGKAGQIGGTELAPVVKGFKAFEAGAKSVNPKFVAMTDYVGSWEDASVAKEKALAMLRQGADMFFQNADAAGQGVFQVVRENRNKGVWAFGSNKDQSETQPDLVLASAVLDVPRAFSNVDKEIREGKFQGQIYHEGLKAGGVTLALNQKLKAQIPTDVLARVEKAQQDIAEGRVQPVPAS